MQPKVLFLKGEKMTVITDKEGWIIDIVFDKDKK